MPTANCSRPDDTNWTGAEVKSCCRLASLLDVPLVQAAQNLAPVAMNTISRMSPPHPGHCSGNSSPSRAISFASSSLPVLMRERRGTVHVVCRRDERRAE